MWNERLKKDSVKSEKPNRYVWEMHIYLAFLTSENGSVDNDFN